MKPMEFIEDYKRKATYPVSSHELINAARYCDPALTPEKIRSAIGAARVGNKILPPPTSVKIGKRTNNVFQ